MDIAIVTDSTADIPQDLLQNFRINVVPNWVIINGKSLVDGEGISRQEFYEKLPSLGTPPTTSTASPGTFQQLYENLLNQGAQKIISVHAASQLSGIYNAANTAAQVFENQVFVIDSGQITLGLGFQVLSAAESIAAGDQFDNVIKLIDNLHDRARVVAMLDTLEYLRRSGRVSLAKARIGNLIRIKSFVELRNGEVHSLGETRTRTKGIARLKEMIIKLGPLERLAILHTNAEADAHQLLEDLNPQLPTQPIVVHVTTVIGTHVGPNGLGFAAIVQ